MQLEELRTIVKTRLVTRIAERYAPPDRLKGNEASQRDWLADLIASTMRILPGNENAESVGLILDNAWRALFEHHRFQAWPQAPEVLGHVRDAVESFRGRTMGGPTRAPAQQQEAASLSPLEHEAIMAKFRGMTRDLPLSREDALRYRRVQGRPHPDEARWWPNGAHEAEAA